MPPVRRKPHESTLHGASELSARSAEDPPADLALALVWSADEPERVGEVVLLPGSAGMAFTLGRSTDPADDGTLPLTLRRLRPGTSEDRGPFESARVSRWQLRLTPLDATSLTVEVVGRNHMRVNGRPLAQASLGLGDLVEVVDRFSLLVTSRPRLWSHARGSVDFAFGQADPDGIVGESPAAWSLREQLGFIGPLDDHVLVSGQSGVGKELAIQALHARSRRAAHPVVARNAATLPDNVLDAELFGNLRNYPNLGTPDRGGLVHQADQSSLFLDAVGELSHAQQARLLRVMDSGEYQRLGESFTRTSRLRLLAATNRELTQLKQDVLARFTHHLRLPGLGSRRDDIPLLARHLVLKFAAENPAQVDRFIRDGEPRFAPRLLAALIHRDYTGHTRELGELLWRSIAASKGATIEAPPGLDHTPPAPPAPASVAVADLTREQIVDALTRCDGVRARAWQALGLRSRDQLKRLMKHHGIT